MTDNIYGDPCGVFATDPDAVEMVCDFLNETSLEEKIKERVEEVMWIAIGSAVRSIMPIIRNVMQEENNKPEQQQNQEVMATKKTTYIEMELEWLETQAQSIKDFCDAHPISEIRDRQIGRKVVATIEVQAKALRDSLQDYIKIIEAINKLREKEEAKKIVTRGDQELTPFETGQV